MAGAVDQNRPLEIAEWQAPLSLLEREDVARSLIEAEELPWAVGHGLPGRHPTMIGSSDFSVA
jgi:hypothetical protein